MKRLDDPEVAAWLKKAQGDLQIAEIAVGLVEPLFDQACFHAQQAGEKALKSLLVALDRAVPRTHDLMVLVAAMRDAVPSVSTLEDVAELLAQYGVGPRYPSFLAAETEAEARAAIAAAREVMRWTQAEFDKAQ